MGTLAIIFVLFMAATSRTYPIVWVFIIFDAGSCASARRAAHRRTGLHRCVLGRGRMRADGERLVASKPCRSLGAQGKHGRCSCKTVRSSLLCCVGSRVSPMFGDSLSWVAVVKTIFSSPHRTSLIPSNRLYICIRYRRWQRVIWAKASLPTERSPRLGRSRES